MPFFPDMKGSSPLWMQTDEIPNPASLLQNPRGPVNLLAPQLRGQRVQRVRNSISGFVYNANLVPQFQHCQKCTLRNFYIAYLTHPFFSFFLFFEKFPFPGNVSTVTFGGNILTNSFNSFT